MLVANAMQSVMADPVKHTLKGYYEATFTFKRRKYSTNTVGLRRVAYISLCAPVPIAWL